MYNVLYKGRRIYSDLTHEECTEILEELAERSYNGEVDQNEIELEEV
jgi:hypothetical protein